MSEKEKVEQSNEQIQKPTKRKSMKKKSKRKSKRDSDDSKPKESPADNDDELEVPTASLSSKSQRPSYSRVSETGAVEELPVREPEGDYNDLSNYYDSRDFQKVTQNNDDELAMEKGPSQTGDGGFMKAAQSQALRPFVIISSSYLLFTITDGAIRMIVLQHAYNKSFSAMQVAVMFTLYELAGVFTNLVSNAQK